MLVFYLFLFLFFFFDKETFTPSYLTLLPTTGTAFIILSSSKENVVNKLLSGKILVSLGLISYSLYLWHYPIFAFAKLQSQNPISSFENILLIFLTLLMSLISWKIIEGPFRNKKIISKKILFFTFFIFTSILILASFLSMKFLPNLYFNTLNDKEKYNFKLIEKHTVYDYEKAIIDNSECHFNSINLDNIFFKRYSECEKKYKKAVIILGDSHGINLYNIITKSLDKKFIVGFTQVGCRPHNGKRENKKNNCLFNEYLDFLNKKRESIEYLIYHQSGALLIKDKYNGRSYYESNLKNELDRFIVNNENVLKIISYLSNINNEVKILWVGPHIESHANFDNIKSFNNGFYVNKNNIKLFNKIEKNIENYLINKRNNINFLPFSKIYKIDRNFLLFNECITFRDKDHFSRCGEDIISQSLKIQTIEEYFN
ncbi:MAG: hypothetical protein CMP34_03115 [Rickettsiales bacterium]|nr:hypothetical protein [Rickettsiales bacterium]